MVQCRQGERFRLSGGASIETSSNNHSVNLDRPPFAATKSTITRRRAHQKMAQPLDMRSGHIVLRLRRVDVPCTGKRCYRKPSSSQSIRNSA